MFEALLRDLRDEHGVLDALVADLDASQWDLATPAEGWTVSDSIRHLAVSEILVVGSLRDDRDPLEGGVGQPSGDGPELLTLWRKAGEDGLATFAEHDENDRVPWVGRRMAVRSLAIARLMETWAHGLDCFAALGVEPVDTARLRHVAWLGWRSLPHAFALSGAEPCAPPTSLRLELTAPDGKDVWVFGPGEPEALVRGPAGDWCRIATHRVRAPMASRLTTDGDLARQAVAVARAFV